MCDYRRFLYKTEKYQKYQKNQKKPDINQKNQKNQDIMVFMKKTMVFIIPAYDSICRMVLHIHRPDFVSIVLQLCLFPPPEV